MKNVPPRTVQISNMTRIVKSLIFVDDSSGLSLSHNILTCWFRAFPWTESLIVLNSVLTDTNLLISPCSMASSLICRIAFRVAWKDPACGGYAPSSGSRTPSCLGFVHSSCWVDGYAGCTSSLSSSFKSFRWRSTVAVGCSSISRQCGIAGCPASGRSGLSIF